jgi:predicted GNAT family N-acyltransferase
MSPGPSFTRFLLGLAAALLIVLGLVAIVRHLRGREWGEELVASSIAECQERVRACSNPR